MDRRYKISGRLLSGLVVLQVLLVSLHLGHIGDVWPTQTSKHELGEFWPFSIYPMFSRGGHPWVRAHMRVVQNTADESLWQERTVRDLPGDPYALDAVGVNQNDIANFIAKTDVWDSDRIAGIRSVFESDLATTNLLIYWVEGSLLADSVSVRFIPFVLLTRDTTAFNPGTPRRSPGAGLP